MESESWCRLQDFFAGRYRRRTTPRLNDFVSTSSMATFVPSLKRRLLLPQDRGGMSIVDIRRSSTLGERDTAGHADVAICLELLNPVFQIRSFGFFKSIIA
ncbi:MAG TPA: hypothetical protein VJN71_02105 [Nitrososphaerales archaeon]|nr:hypothetical protein [Nitrososphaerales archaeon]